MKRINAVQLDDLEGALVAAGVQIDVQQTPLGDQVESATREQGATHDAVAAILGARNLDVGRSDVPDWQRLLIVDALLGFIQGTASTCVHDPSLRRPEPLYAAAWRPGVVGCKHCLHLFRLKPGSIRDRTCDGCGQVVDKIHPQMLTRGPLSLMFGTCDDCT